VQLGGLGKLKKFTSLGLEPMTFWLVAQWKVKMRKRKQISYIVDGGIVCEE
jgi:hypothetical protein